jgi:hypothetical protein
VASEKENKLEPLQFRQLLTLRTISQTSRPTQQFVMKLTAKLGYVATTGGHNVATYTLPKQANRAVLHSHRAIHDDPWTSHRGDGYRSPSKSIDDVDPWRNHVGGWAGDGSRAQYLVGGGALVVVVTLVGWMAYQEPILLVPAA